MSKPLSILLLILAASLTLWRGSEAFFKLWHYLRLDSVISAKIENWQVEELSPSKYALTASFTYTVQDVERKGISQLPPPFFPNRYAAADAIPYLPSGEVKIWIDRSNPSYTALEREFPWLPFLYTLSSLGIFLFFLYLRVSSRIF